jgi:putative peptide zinc metalloprotease protein
MSAPALAASPPPGTDLPPLREELQLLPGSPAWDGGPTWLIHDPPAGQFIRIGWAEFEMLTRWHLRNPEKIATAVSCQTSLGISPTDVMSLCERLQRMRLVGLPGKDTQGLAKEYAARRSQGLFARLLKSYIFFRVPLVRPDGFLRSLSGKVRWAYSRLFMVLTIAAALLGLFLAIRQWDTFIGGFPYLLTGPGVAVGLLALMILKVLHELGHGFTGRRYGVRARRAGVAVMFFVPMLYTDLTDAWRLTSRWQRVMIGAAGILTELMVACWALLLWNFVPDGVFRSVLFFWATAAWILTVIVNSSPFLRFDGYYILSDAIDQPNLHSTAFALSRWHLRRVVLGLQEASPVRCSRARERFLIGFGYATWFYRLFLFLGIAYILYLLPLKVFGIFLAAVEIWWFILRPITQELGIWWKRKSEFGMNKTIIRSAIFLGGLSVVFLAPFQTAVHGEAVVAAERRTIVLAPASGQIMSLEAEQGVQVTSGMRLALLSSPQLVYETDRLRSELENLDRMIGMSGRSDTLTQRVSVLISERASRAEELRSVESEIDLLDIRAPFDATVVERADRLVAQDWVGRGEPIFILADLSEITIDGFVTESDIARIEIGSTGQLHFSSDGLRPVDVRVVGIDAFSLENIPYPLLSSVHGGPVASRTDADGRLVPVTPIYRVYLTAMTPIVANRMEHAHLRLDARAESYAGHIWRVVAGTIIRETGF